MKHFVFTGGGTAGHVIPNLVLMDELRRRGYPLRYIGTRNGMERGLVEDAGFSYHGIPSGKLRRYFSWRNISDVFFVAAGVLLALLLLLRHRPLLVFSKGGFVTVPVVFSAWLLRIPVIAHESDLTPGLATRLSAPFVEKVLTAFPPTAEHMGAKATCLGLPLRANLFQGRRERAFDWLGWQEAGLPVLMIMGGSLGAQAINRVVRESLADLLRSYRVVHLTGRGQLDPSHRERGYKQIEFVQEELPDLLAAADCVVSRAGASAICELLALGKSHVLVPLPAAASRGDQLQNAAWLESIGASIVVPESELQAQRLLSALEIATQEYDREATAAAKLAEIQRQASDQILRVVLLSAGLPVKEASPEGG